MSGDLRRRLEDRRRQEEERYHKQLPVDDVPVPPSLRDQLIGDVEPTPTPEPTPERPTPVSPRPPVDTPDIRDQLIGAKDPEPVDARTA